MQRSVARWLSRVFPDKGTVVEMVCLANSRKHGGRCLAGLRTDGGGWIRPVGEGALDERQVAVRGGGPRPLETVRVDLAEPCPRPHQPENWRLRRVWYNPWYRPVRPGTRMTPEHLLTLLRKHRVTGATLLGDRCDRVNYAAFLSDPASVSLALVAPQNLRWHVTSSSRGLRQTRALFCLDGVAYDLPVTDPLWEKRLSGLPVGVHPTPGLAETETLWLTVSLGDPFNEYSYKLVAAVVLVPLAWNVGGSAI